MRSSKIRTKSTGAAREGVNVAQYCAAWDMDLGSSFAWDNRWGAPLEAAAVGSPNASGLHGRASDPPTANHFAQARRWYRVQGFVRQILGLRYAFFTHGLLGETARLSDPADPQSEAVVEVHPGIKAVNRKDQAKVDKWKREKRREIAQYIRDAWLEWLMLDNVIGLWRKSGRPLVYPPENVTYSDLFGEEQIKIRHGLKYDQIEAMQGLTREEKNLLKTQAEITITKSSSLFSFDVVKRERIGMGLAWPNLATIFHTCAGMEGLEVGDRMLADACRNVYEQHQVGHEIKSGPLAGAGKHFCNPKRAAVVEKSIRGQPGYRQMITNFDHKVIIGAGLPNPAQFDSKRYDGFLERLALWAMPLGQMIFAKSVNPFLTMLLRGQAETERVPMDQHVLFVLQEALGAPAALRLQYDDTIFWDSRLLLDVLKTGMNAGPIPQSTFLEKTGFDRMGELEKKAAEAKLPPELLCPAWDPHHGKEPGKPDKPGRPALT